MSRVLILLIVSCLACGIIARSTCLDRCSSGCFVDSAQQRCRACPAGCNNCTDPHTCTNCTSGYFLNEEKNCVECAVSGCANCTERGVCTACQSGYFLYNSSSCQFCGYLCETCLSNTTCKTCRQDTFAPVYFSRIGGGTCNYCPDGCTSCRNSGVCDACKPGYILLDFQCLSCTAIDSECSACDESIKNCTQCNKGHYVFNNTCLECSAGCENCTSETQCQNCSQGYFLNENKGCTPCMKGCKTCNESGVCLDCHEGYEYSSEESKCNLCELDCVGVSIPYIPPMPLPMLNAAKAEATFQAQPAVLQEYSQGA